MDTRLVLFLATLLGFCTCKSQDILLDEVTADVVSDFVTSVEFGSARSVCRPVPSAMTLCRGLGYGHMRLPTLLGHESAREAQQQSGAWLPLVHKRCHRDITRFLCSLFAPACLPELDHPVRPCRRLCENVRNACAPVMNAFGFSWPHAFNCSHFPGLNSTLCVPGSDATSRDVIDVLQGNVLCDACSPESDAEHEIEENFCRSQFAFRLQIGSSSLEGLDLRVEPQGQSRVLRWEGGEQEQQVAMQQSALWLRDAGNCSCQALDGRSFGPLLALGDLKDGRIVLSRLVKWPHRERELKKFIRKLSKKPC
ncbi:secreted frizzled-related protein 2-like [Silurus asotus]|uniref:Secreted frizzled-related protein 2-like n=1 Tax=Silurus asotus TaxID=30991 RepID=A0AAD5AYP0_SILAS|nr:secreted frizzled-related protein 2-like [Silurus asotus]